MRICHLVRHGQSTWNVAGRVQGQTAHPQLTALGVQQAQDAARRLAQVVGPGARLWTSDLVRAAQTARIIGSRLGLEPVETVALREQSLGELEGLPRDQLRPQETPDGVHVSEVPWGAGESVLDVHNRLRRFLDSIDDGEHVLVTHGDTLRIALAVLDGRSHRQVDWSPMPNGAVVTWRGE